MPVGFYRYSLKTAVSDNDEDLYYESNEEDVRCRKYIEDSKTGFHANAYKDYVVDKGNTYTKELIEKFGYERVMSIYAETIKASINDGRISAEVRDWAKNFNAGLRHNEDKSGMILKSMHIGVVDILAKKAIEEYENLNLFTNMHCESELGDLEGKVIVISPKRLKEEFWDPKHQLWLAKGGFGCSPTASGRAIYSLCLYDDYEQRWNRGDVVGVLKEKFLPEWAREKLEQLNNPEPEIGLNLN